MSRQVVDDDTTTDWLLKTCAFTKLSERFFYIAVLKVEIQLLKMAESGLASETRMLPHSLEQMCVSTPVGKESSNYIPLPLSPPQTLDINQKRQRSQSLMMSHQSNDMIATKRRLRSRSRLGLGPEDVPSAFMSPPTTKPRERTQSRSHKHNEMLCYPEVFSKHLTVDVEGTLNSVYMTPTSERREPLQNKDINTVDSGISRTFDKKGWLTTESCSSDEGDTVLDEDDKTRVKLDFDHYATVPDSQVNPSPVTPDHNRTIGRRMGEKKMDFIKELVLLNCEEICKQILCHLQPRDLLR